MTQGTSGTRLLLGPPFHRHWQGAAGHSIKAYIGGRVPFRVERQVHLVGDDAFLFVNAGQDYEFRTPNIPDLFNLTIFLSDTDARDAWASIRRTERELLDDPAGTETGSDPDFFVTPLRISPEVSALHSELRRRALSRALSDEAKLALTADLMLHAFYAQAEALGQARRVAAARRATREEVARRVRRAIHAIEEDAAVPFDLEALARLACMSKHHFLRRFREVAGETPYRFILTRRLARARDLLARDTLSVAQIGRACGFTDASAFSSAFRAAHGMPPGEWRRRSPARRPHLPKG